MNDKKGCRSLCVQPQLEGKSWDSIYVIVFFQVRLLLTIMQRL